MNCLENLLNPATSGYTSGPQLQAAAKSLIRGIRAVRACPAKNHGQGFSRKAYAFGRYFEDPDEGCNMCACEKPLKTLNSEVNPEP